MGLINKAVSKVENQENLPVREKIEPQDREKEEEAPAQQGMQYQSKKIQENPPTQGTMLCQVKEKEGTPTTQKAMQPHAREQDEKSSSQQVMPSRAKGKGKKKIMVLTGTLLLVGIFLGLGYFVLLMPQQEVPPKTVRRSISARKKLPKPTPISSDQKAGAEAKETLREGNETISNEDAEKSLTLNEPVMETGVLSEQKEKPSSPEGKAPVEVSESQISEIKKEPETAKPDIEPPGDPALTSNFEDEGKIPKDAIPPSEETISSSEPILDEAVSPAEEKILEEEIRPYYPLDLKDWPTRTPLTVTQRSDSRAQKYYNKGVSYQKEGDLDGAIKSYRKALSFNPDHLQTQMNLATAYLQAGRLKEAEQKLNYLYALRPNDCRTLFNLGLLLYQIRELPSAEVKLKRLLALDPLHLEANLLLGSVYEEKGEYSKALEFCMKAYYIDSANPRVIYRAGRAWDMTGDEKKAMKYYRLFLNTGWENENGLRLAVLDRLNYLISQKEGK